MRGETNSHVAMSLLASPSLTSRTVAFGGGERCPAAGRAFAFAAAALCVGYRVSAGRHSQGGSFSRGTPSTDAQIICQGQVESPRRGQKESPPLRVRSVAVTSRVFRNLATSTS